MDTKVESGTQTNADVMKRFNTIFAIHQALEDLERMPRLEDPDKNLRFNQDLELLRLALSWLAGEGAIEVKLPGPWGKTVLYKDKIK